VPGLLSRGAIPILFFPKFTIWVERGDGISKAFALLVSMVVTSVTSKPTQVFSASQTNSTVSIDFIFIIQLTQ
jgi:hypothetical protein